MVPAVVSAAAAIEALTEALPKDFDPAVAREVLVYSSYRDAELRGSNLTYRLLRILDEVLRPVTRDEGWHIDWVPKKAREIAAGEGEPGSFDRLLEKYRQIDREVMDEIEDLERQLASAA